MNITAQRLPRRAWRYALSDIPQGGFSPLSSKRTSTIGLAKIISVSPGIYNCQWVEAVLSAAPVATSRACLHARRDARMTYVPDWQSGIDDHAPPYIGWLIRRWKLLSLSWLVGRILVGRNLATGGNLRFSSEQLSGFCWHKTKFSIGVRGAHTTIYKITTFVVMEKARTKPCRDPAVLSGLILRLPLPWQAIRVSGKPTHSL
jgi:hypothetical protein